MGLTKYRVGVAHNYRVDRLITASTVAQWLWRANHWSKQPRWPHPCRVSDNVGTCVSEAYRRACHCRHKPSERCGACSPQMASTSYELSSRKVVCNRLEQWLARLNHCATVDAVVMRSTRYLVITLSYNNAGVQTDIRKCDVTYFSSPLLRHISSQ